MTARPLTMARRMLTPGWYVSLVYLRRFGAKISPKAEVDVSPNLRMGKGCVIGSFTKVKASDGPVTLGSRCGIATNCFIAGGPKGIVVGDNFVCGPGVVVTASNYVYSEIGVHLEDQGITSKGVRIGDNVWIGAGSVILDGSVLGDNCIVVAGSLVNRRYPANAVIQGNPAKILTKRA